MKTNRRYTHEIWLTHRQEYTCLVSSCVHTGGQGDEWGLSAASWSTGQTQWGASDVSGAWPCYVSSSPSSGCGVLFLSILCATAGSLMDHQIRWLLGWGLSMPLFYPFVWGRIHFSNSVLACTIGGDHSHDGGDENQSLFIVLGHLCCKIIISVQPWNTEPDCRWETPRWWPWSPEFFPVTWGSQAWHQGTLLSVSCTLCTHPECTTLLHSLPTAYYFIT